MTTPRDFTKYKLCQRCCKPVAEIHTCTPTPLVRAMEKKIESLESALKIISTWARFDNDGDGGMYALRPRDVISLIDKALAAKGE